MNRFLASLLALLALMPPALADMYPDASNAKLPDARTNLAIAPHVATNAALTAAATMTYPGGVWRDDFSAGNGAPPLWFLPESGTCAANSRVNDGGSCVNTNSGGNSWYAVFPANGGDVREWGVKFDGSTDNSTALQAAFTWMALGNALALPAALSSANYATGISVTLASGVSASILGQGDGVSVLKYTGASGTALSVAYAGLKNSVDAERWSLVTSHGGGATGINLSQAGTSPSGYSQVSRWWVTLRGDDGPAGSHYWTTGFAEAEVSDLDLVNLNVWGDSGTNATTCVSLVGNSPEPSVAINIGGWVNYCKTGVLVGQYVQGLTVSHANIIGVVDGVKIPNNTGTGQLNIEFSSFGATHAAVWDEGGIFGLTVTDNFMQANANSAAGVMLDVYGSASVKGNTCNGGGHTGMTCISATRGGQSVTISGNNLTPGTGVATGVNYAATVTGAAECNNAFNSATNPVVATNGAIVDFCSKVLISGNSLGSTGLYSPLLVGWGAGTSLTTDQNVVLPVTQTGAFFWNFKVFSSVAPGGGNGYIPTFYTTSGASSLNCPIGVAQFCSDTNLAHLSSAAGTHYGYISIATSGSPTAGAKFSWTVELVTNP